MKRYGPMASKQMDLLGSFPSELAPTSLLRVQVVRTRGLHKTPKKGT